MMRETWCVQVSYMDDDPDKFGPYTERQAHRIAARLNLEVKATGRKHPGDVTHAVAIPFVRYDDFLTAAELRACRQEINEAYARGEGGAP